MQSASLEWRYSFYPEQLLQQFPVETLSVATVHETHTSALPLHDFISEFDPLQN